MIGAESVNGDKDDIRSFILFSVNDRIYPIREAGFFSLCLDRNKGFFRALRQLDAVEFLEKAGIVCFRRRINVFLKDNFSPASLPTVTKNTTPSSCESAGLVFFAEFSSFVIPMLNSKMLPSGISVSNL